MLTTDIKKVFRKVRPEEVEAEQLYEAQLALVTHEAAAEHHAALADMYRARVERLTAKGIGQTVTDARPIEFRTGKRLAS